MDDDTMTTTPAAPSSWRDVYQLVSDMESRVTKRLDEGFAAQGAVTQDHEVRLRVLEKTDSTQAARSDARVQVLSVGRTTLLTIMSIGSMAVGVIALIK